MDRYEYKQNSDKIKKLYEAGDFTAVVEMADDLDWTKINNSILLNIAADSYEKTGKWEDAYELLEFAYESAGIGRSLAYRLCLLALKLGRMGEATEYYTDFGESFKRSITASGKI